MVHRKSHRSRASRRAGARRSLRIKRAGCGGNFSSFDPNCSELSTINWSNGGARRSRSARRSRRGGVNLPLSPAPFDGRGVMPSQRPFYRALGAST